MKKRILSLALSAFIALALVPPLGVDAGAYDVNIDDGISQEELLRGGIPDSPLWPLNADANGYSSTFGDMPEARPPPLRPLQTWPQTAPMPGQWHGPLNRE